MGTPVVVATTLVTSFTVSIPKGTPPVVLLSIKDSSGNSGTATPTTPSGTWTRYSSGSYDSLWVGKGLPSSSYVITVTNSVSTQQGAIALPLFGVAPTITSQKSVTGAAYSPSGSNQLFSVPQPVITQSPIQESLIVLSTTMTANSGCFNRGFYTAEPGTVSTIFIGDTSSIGTTGFLSAVVVPAGSFDLQTDILYSAAKSPVPNFTSNSIIIT